jgi:hypothetical protein
MSPALNFGEDDDEILSAETDDVPLTGTRRENGTGVSLTGTVSQQWRWTTLYINVAAALTQEQQTDYFFDTIIEGPHDWAVRPVCEFFYELDVGEFATSSGLVGAIWQAKDNVAVDFAVRGARINDRTAGEIRAGVTFAFGLPKALGLPSERAAATRPGSF